MTPSIVAFSNFLLDDNPRFKTLREVTACIKNGNPIISRTSQFAEAQIEIDGKHYMLCLPLSGTVEPSVERICIALTNLSPVALTEYRLFKNEITMPDSMGQDASFDVILHAIPEGEPLDKAALFVTTGRLRTAFDMLKRELTAIGFVHGNLKPSNLIYGTDRHLYPIRYNYARLGATAEEVENDLRNIAQFIENTPEIAEIGEEPSTLTEYTTPRPCDEHFPMQDMMRRVRKGELYGYLDDEDSEVIAPQFIYAENFFENRAVVQTVEGKMGVIDHDCKWIVEPIYDMVGFEDGLFDARLGEHWIKIDYLGNIIE